MNIYKNQPLRKFPYLLKPDLKWRQSLPCLALTAKVSVKRRECAQILNMMARDKKEQKNKQERKDGEWRLEGGAHRTLSRCASSTSGYALGLGFLEKEKRNERKKKVIYLNFLTLKKQKDLQDINVSTKKILSRVQGGVSFGVEKELPVAGNGSKSKWMRKREGGWANGQWMWKQESDVNTELINVWKYWRR